jgi:hypothetical protein
MDYSLLSCDLICGPDGMPYRCLGIFEVYDIAYNKIENITSKSVGKSQRVEIEIDLKEEMTIKDIKEQLFINFDEFKHNFETIQSAKAQMKKS